ncbi:DUF2381 family protein [Corallococcus carmarthensis]|uniref:DUF2381 family protein n=1 Tax=Corallococcus carmarthensis TaxID=2316728 RepID=UPI00148D9744|nr:DUF2381 family protein [Corallococcus carmarthensis]
MPSCLFVALPVLLWSTHVLAAPRVEKDVGEGPLRLEVEAENTGARPIHIGPGVSTTLLFDTDIQQDQVSLESRAQFARVSTGSSVLVLVPSSELQQGETLKLSIPFKDAGSALPARLSLTLVVDSGSVDRHVEVYRRARSAESYRQEVQQLRTELERLRQERGSPAGGAREQSVFRGLLLSTTDFPGITVQRGTKGVFECLDRCSLLIEKGSTYSSGIRRAVKLSLRAADKKPWTIGRAVLVDRQGKKWEALPPAQSGPISAEAAATLALEFEMNNLDLGAYQLNVSDVDGKRTMQWKGFTFP